MATKQKKYVQDKKRTISLVLLIFCKMCDAIAEINEKRQQIWNEKTEKKIGIERSLGGEGHDF